VPSLDDPLSWGILESTDTVFFVAGADGVLERARTTGFLSATTRSLPPGPGVALDAAIGSSNDESEVFAPGDLKPDPGLSIWTDGAAGGRWRTSGGREGAYEAVPPPGPIADAYGAGDSFAAGTTYALGRGDSIEDAVKLGAECGAAAMTRNGPYE
jgi:ribokinase